VINLRDERNLVSVLPGTRPEHANCRSYCVTPSLKGKLNNILRIKIRGIGSERCAGGVSDTLVHRKDGQIACACKSPGDVKLLKAAQHPRFPVAGNEDTIDKVWSASVEAC